MSDSSTMVNELVESTDEEQLSTFLSMFPTPLHYTIPRDDLRLWSFWSQSKRSQNNLSSDDPEIHDPWVIHEKIKSLLSDLTFSDLEGLIQFWAPVTISGRRLLTTSGQPFALTSLDTVLAKHRLCFVGCQYDIDANKPEGEHDPTIIRTGATAIVFLDLFPMFIEDLSVQGGCPLVAYLGLPICHHSQTCVGVLDIFMTQFGCHRTIFTSLKGALEGVDLSTLHAGELMTYKTLDGLIRAKYDVREALKVACEGSREKTRQMIEECILPSNTRYKTAPVSLDREMIEQQFGRTTKEAARNLKDVASSSRNEAEFFKIHEEIKSSLTPEVPREKTRQMIKESILPPNARYKTAPVSLNRQMIKQQFGRTMKEAAINLNVSESTLKRKCKDAGIFEWQGPNFGKRKVNESYNNQVDTNEEDGAIQNPLAVNEEINWDESSLTLKAKYRDNMIKFHLPIPAVTLAAIQEVINKDFQLDHGTYKLEYRDEDGDWILMNCNQHVEDCIKSLRLLNRTTLIRLRVVPL